MAGGDALGPGVDPAGDRYGYFSSLADEMRPVKRSLPGGGAQTIPWHGNSRLSCWGFNLARSSGSVRKTLCQVELYGRCLCLLVIHGGLQKGLIYMHALASLRTAWLTLCLACDRSGHFLTQNSMSQYSDNAVRNHIDPTRQRYMEKQKH